MEVVGLSQRQIINGHRLLYVQNFFTFEFSKRVTLGSCLSGVTSDEWELYLLQRTESC